MSIFSEVTFNPQQSGADAGGVLRVGSQTTLFDGKELNSENTNIWETVGTGTGVFDANKYSMSVAAGEYIIRQSRRRMPYFSGKSQRVEQTFDNFAPATGVQKRFGYFSSNAVAPYDSTLDGFYIESSSGTITLHVVRSGVSVLNLDITQWSGYNDLGSYQNASTWDNFTVVEFKFLWLGGAVLVVSVKTDNGFTEAHRFNYAGTSPDVFFDSPNQPLRYEIRSTTGTGTFRSICSQCATEGSTTEDGESISVYNGTGVSANVSGTIYALLGVRKATAFRDVPVQVVDMIGIEASATTDSGVLMLMINPTLSAPLSYAANSCFEVAYATNQTITAGTGRVVAATSVVTSGGATAVLDNNYLSFLSSSIDNTMDEYVLAYMPTTANQELHGILNLKEY